MNATVEQDNIITAVFTQGKNDNDFVEYKIVVFKEDAEYFESKLLDEIESVFFASKQMVEPIRRMEAP